MKQQIPGAFFQKRIVHIVIILFTSVIVTAGIDFLLPSALPLILHDGMRPGISKNDRNDLMYTELKVAYNELSQGNCILIDVRDESEFMKLHPVGSINLPFHESEEIYGEFSDKVSVDKKIYILCEGALCAMSVRIASHLAELGYKNTIIIKRDFKEWQRLNLPTETGSEENTNIK
jgi:rhodanese-related sulfurtransferase